VWGVTVAAGRRAACFLPKLRQDDAVITVDGVLLAYDVIKMWR